MLERFRAAWQRILTPVARALLRMGVTPDLITWIGTAGAVGFAVVCYPLGWLWPGTVGISAFIFSDMIDGQMARVSRRSSRWGAFLDSSLDRVADGAIFGALALYFAGPGRATPGGPVLWAGVTLVALVMGQVTSYVKARAETIGIKVPGGLAARADRILVVLVAAFLAGLGVPWVLPGAMCLLAAATTWTVGQRMWSVWRQTRPTAEDEAAGSTTQILSDEAGETILRPGVVGPNSWRPEPTERPATGDVG